MDLYQSQKTDFGLTFCVITYYVPDDTDLTTYVFPFPFTLDQHFHGVTSNHYSLPFDSF